jgi:hypothetical protein
LKNNNWKIDRFKDIDLLTSLHKKSFDEAELKSLSSFENTQKDDFVLDDDSIEWEERDTFISKLMCADLKRKRSIEDIC